MHICHCFKDFSLSEGGIERHIHYLSKEPIHNGYKVSALVSRPKGSEEKADVEGINEYRVNSLFKLYKVPIMPEYYKHLSMLDPDIVHAHATMPNISDVAVLYARNKKKASLLHYHVDGNAESLIGSVVSHVYNISINTYIVSKADRVITETKTYAETSPVLRQYLKKVEVVPNGVDLALFNPSVEKDDIYSKYNLPDGHIIFSAGRLVKYKGFEYLIKAMASIKDTTLLIAGVGQDERRLKALVKENGIKNIVFLSLIPHEELPKFHNISDIYIVPSITRGENFGIAPLEAMACGTPVVASNLPGHREFISEDCGIFIKPKDINGLAHAINSLLDNNKLRLKMSMAARKNAENYSWDITSKKIIDIYKDLSQ